MQDEADRHLIVFQVIQERATAGVGLQRPSEGVLDQARPVLVGRNLPELLQPDAELLRLATVRKVELGDQLLGERPAHAFADQHILYPSAPCRAGSSGPSSRRVPRPCRR